MAFFVSGSVLLRILRQLFTIIVYPFVIIAECVGYCIYYFIRYTLDKLMCSLATGDIVKHFSLIAVFTMTFINLYYNVNFTGILPYLIFFLESPCDMFNGYDYVDMDGILNSSSSVKERMNLENILLSTPGGNNGNNPMPGQGGPGPGDNVAVTVAGGSTLQSSDHGSPLQGQVDTNSDNHATTDTVTGNANQSSDHVDSTSSRTEDRSEISRGKRRAYVDLTDDTDEPPRSRRRVH